MPSSSARSRRHRPASPLQKALEPGSQDEIRGTPLTTPGADVDAAPAAQSKSTRRQHHTTTTTTTTTTSGTEECLGKYLERFDHQHQTPEGLAAHLRVFLGFRGAPGFVDKYGMDRINAAIQEMALRSTGDLKNPAGFLRWLVENEG